MRHSKEENEIKQLLLENGLDLSKFLIGTGDTYLNKKSSCRFEFNVTNRKEENKKSAHYAIKYFSQHNFFIVWKPLSKTKFGKNMRRGVLSVKTSDVFSKTTDGVRKYVGYIAHNQEDVYVYSWDELKAFVSSLKGEKL